MQTFLNVAQIIVAAGLIIIVILQARTSSAGSMFGGGDSPVYHTKRGIERTLFNATVLLSVVFFVFAILNVMTAGG